MNFLNSKNGQSTTLVLNSSVNHRPISAQMHKPKPITPKIFKKNYYKLNNEQIEKLKQHFLNNQYYPKKKEIIRLSDELDIGVKKIENWLKYERRKLSQKIVIQKYKRRKKYSTEDKNILLEHFKNDPTPSKLKIEEIAKLISCTPKNIENWFGNYRKKQKNTKNQQKNAIKETNISIESNKIIKIEKENKQKEEKKENQLEPIIVENISSQSHNQHIEIQQQFAPQPQHPGIDGLNNNNYNNNNPPPPHHPQLKSVFLKNYFIYQNFVNYNMFLMSKILENQLCSNQTQIKNENHSI